MTFNLEGKRTWVAGHRGMVGSAIVRRLNNEPIGDLIVAPSSEVDLSRQQQAEEFIRASRPAVAILAAAKVGGINANRTAQADFLYDNAIIALNCLRACQTAGVEKIVVLGSSCIYPREVSQPITEEQLLAGPLEPTNEGYAIAKIAALEYGKMLRRQYGLDVISLMPTNLYGPGDNYDLDTSHVLPALLRKVHEAKLQDRRTVPVWGSGRPRREFLHVDDLAEAVIFALRHYSGDQHLNVGTGEDISIADLAYLISQVVEWNGELEFDPSMPDGVMRKQLDVSRLKELGWTAQIDLRTGIELTYQSFLRERNEAA